MKTLIGVLASHDGEEKNNTLARLFDKLVVEDPEKLEKFAFVFTGGTFDRILLGKEDPRSKIEVTKVKPRTRNFLLTKCGVIRLPPGREGGVIILSYLVVKRVVSIIWPFLTSKTMHWLNPDNLALMRLCDQWSAKRLMTKGSIEEWFEKEGDKDSYFNPIDWPLERIPPPPEDHKQLEKEEKEEKFILAIEEVDKVRILATEINRKAEEELQEECEGDGISYSFGDIYVCPKCDKEYGTGTVKTYCTACQPPKGKGVELELYLVPGGERLREIPALTEKHDYPEEVKQRIIALVAHDEMKERMEEFAIYYGQELAKFKWIITTGTTGKCIKDAVPLLKEKVALQYSGPKGGDIEIATQILSGTCHVVIFFIDPLNPHPHIDDIRVVFAACMIQDQVHMISNEIQAREWIETVVRKRYFHPEPYSTKK